MKPQAHIPAGKQLARLLLLAILSFLGARPTQASITTTALSEDFSSGNVPPSGWSEQNGAWYYSSAGDGDYNGSAVVNMYGVWYTPDYLTTSQIDASAWSAATDDAYLDFDLFWEYNDFNSDYGDDNFQIYFVNSSNGPRLTLDLYTSNDYTYYNAYGSYSVMYDPSTSSGDWRHYHVPIPSNYRTSDLQVMFQDNPGYGSSNPAIDNVTITGTHYNSFTFSPASKLTFGPVSVGNTLTKSITLSNPNPIPINLSNIQLTSGDFNIVNAPTSIPAGSPAEPGTATIDISFTPTVGGAEAAVLTFNSDADIPTSVTIAISGTGVTPILSTETTSLFHRTNVKLGSSMTQTFAVTNTGVGFVQILPSTHIGGDYPGEYSIVRLPSEGIANGAVDSITIRYSPTMEWQHSATLFVESNGGEVQLPLTGIGILPHLVITPSPFQFAPTPVGTPITQTFTLSNTGTDTLVINSTTFTSADYDFTLTGFASKTKIVAGASKTITVTFTPLRSGSRFATLHIATNIRKTFTTPSIDTSGFDVPISGTGLSTGRFTFGIGLDSVIISTTHCVMDTIRNTGKEPMTITSAQLGGTNASEFSISDQSFPITIAAGGYQALSLCFTPSTRGIRQASIALTGTSNGITLNATMNVAGVGLQPCASASNDHLFDAVKTLIGTTDTERVTITNCGDATTSYTANLTGNTSPYTLLGAPVSLPVAPGRTATFTVVFKPTDRNESDALLTIVGGVGISPMLVTLEGIGAGVVLATDGQPGNVVKGSLKDFTVTITNNGNVDWTPGSPQLSGTFSSDYAIVSPLTPTVLSAGGSGTLMLRFTPSTTSDETVDLLFPSSTPAPQQTYDYKLNGAGVANSSVASDAAALSMGSVYPNPAQTMASLDYTVKTNSFVRIDLVDTKGITIQTVVNGLVGQGQHTASFDLSLQPSGTYFIVLRHANAVEIREISVVR